MWVALALMKGSCLAGLPFHLSHQLALTTLSMQQMFTEPEFELISLVFPLRSQENFAFVSQEIIILCPYENDSENWCPSYLSCWRKLPLNSRVSFLRAALPSTDWCEPCLLLFGPVASPTKVCAWARYSLSFSFLISKVKTILLTARNRSEHISRASSENHVEG